MFTRALRPENSVKKAEEYVRVEAYHDALTTLHATMGDYYRSMTWSKHFEDVMNLLIELAVQLREGKIAKDALVKYRILCTDANAKSIRMITEKYLDLARQRVQEAQARSEAEILKIVDLDEDDSPESLLIQSVTGDDFRMRADRTHLTPWVRFLWESYRNVLDCFKVHSNMEQFYHDTVAEVFDFCLKYERKGEFRRLCEILRHHLRSIRDETEKHEEMIIRLRKERSRVTSITKYEQKEQVFSNASLLKEKTVSLNLSTRFSQLRVATTLELWQEAWKIVEDITSLMQRSAYIRPNMLMEYYDRVAQVFWMSHNHKFHLYALLKEFNVARTPGLNISSDSWTFLCDLVVLSYLSVPMTDNLSSTDDEVSTENERERSIMRSAFLNSPKIPTRSWLREQLISYDVTRHASPVVQTLWKLLEEQFDLFEMDETLKVSLDSISQHAILGRYVKPMEDNIILRMLIEISNVYDSLTLDRFAGFVKFIPFVRIERAIMETLRHPQGQRMFGSTIQFDFRRGIVAFRPKEIGSEQVRDQLSTLASRLFIVERMINPEIEIEDAEHRDALFVDAVENEKEEHEEILGRAALLEERLAERLRLENERKFMKKYWENVENERKAREQEEIRRAIEARREMERKIEVEKAKELLRCERLIEEYVKRGVRVKKTLDQWKDECKMTRPFELFDTISRDLTELERVENEKKQSTCEETAQRMNYLERARREEERPYILKRHQDFVEESFRTYEQNVETEREAFASKQNRNRNIRDQLAKIAPFLGSFTDSLLQRRREDYEIKFEKQQSRYEEQHRTWKVEMDRRRRRNADRLASYDEEQNIYLEEKAVFDRMVASIREEEESRYQEKLQEERLKEEEAARKEAEKAAEKKKLLEEIERERNQNAAPETLSIPVPSSDQLRQSDRVRGDRLQDLPSSSSPDSDNWRRRDDRNSPSTSAPPDRGFSRRGAGASGGRGGPSRGGQGGRGGGSSSPSSSAPPPLPSRQPRR